MELRVRRIRRRRSGSRRTHACPLSGLLAARHAGGGKDLDAEPDTEAAADVVLDSADDGPAGDDAAIDVAADTSADADDGGETDGGGSGCGCNVAADPQGRATFLPLLLFALLAVLRFSPSRR